MTILKALSTITLALLTTVANANTTDVNTTDITKVQPINTAELVQSVEIHLADSMKQLSVNFQANKLAQKPLFVISNGKKTADKPFEAKVALLAE